MKILLCKGQFLGRFSGADETLVTYATQLKLAGHTVSVLLMYPQESENQYYVRLREAGVAVSSIASATVTTSMGAGRRLALGTLRAVPSTRSFVRKNAEKMASTVAERYGKQCRTQFEQSGADLIHVLTPDPSAMVMIRAAYAAGIPVMYQELGIPYHPPDFERYYQRFTSVLPLCTEIAALSPRLADDCREKLPGSSQPSVLPIMSDELLNGHRVNSDPAASVVFGFAARIEKLKGPIILMEAFARAHNWIPNIGLKVAGEGSQRKSLERRAESLNLRDHYDYHGVYTRPADRAAFMRSLDVFVMPSFTEGTPNSIIEAMAHGIPIIASSVGGIPDMIHAESGILVPPGNINALSQAILCLARDPQLRARMGIAARDRYLKLFSPQAVLPVVLETYRRVSGSNGTHAPANGNGHRHPWVTKST